MKQKARICTLLIVLVFGACSLAPRNSTAPLERPDAAALFDIAESFLTAHSYEKALKIYKRYLDVYPNGAKADLVLMRIAGIYSEQNDHDAERMAYQRLVAEYPHSRFVTDARVEILMALHQEGDFRGVILLAAEIIEKADSKSHLFRTYAILGDTYMSLDSPKDAMFFYHFAYQHARSPEEKDILFKLKTIINQFSTEDTLSLLMRLDDPFLRGYLLYRLGVNRYENQNYEEALKIFSEIIENFPDHECVNQAKNLIEEINQKFAFQRRLIGCLLPLSGPYEAFGQRALNGFQFALDTFNSQSTQPPFEMIVKDSGSVPQMTIESTRQLAENQVSIIIGPIISGEYAAQEAQANGIPIITLTQKPGIPELGDYVFRAYLTPQMQIDAIVSYVIDRLGLLRFAVLYPEDRYGITFMELFKDTVLDYGATVAAVESYKPDQTDFGSQIKKLSKTFSGNQDKDTNDGQWSGFRGKNRHTKSEVILDFDAIFIPDVPEKIALIAPQLAFYDINDVLLLGTNLWHSDKLIQTAGEYIQDAIMADVFYPEDPKWTVQEFIDSFEEFHGQSPGFIEALAYDAAMIVFHAASNPRVKSRKDLRDELQNFRNFEGVTGLTSFKENGDAAKKLYLLQVQDNIFVALNSD